MPTTSENLTTAYANACQALADWTASKPSYSKAGQSVQWTQHYETLSRVVRDLKLLIAEDAGPYEVSQVNL